MNSDLTGRYRELIARELQLDHLCPQSFTKTEIIAALDRADWHLEAEMNGQQLLSMRKDG